MKSARLIENCNSKSLAQIVAKKIKAWHMNSLYHVYCDESCHLENDRQKAMVIGSIWCPSEVTRHESLAIKKIKQRHGLSDSFEIKWTKVSYSKIDFYKDIVNYFFESETLHFRALLVPDKTKLNHSKFPGQDHEEFYYKMYFQMLHPIFNPNSKYRIFMDIKDSLGITKQKKLHEILCSKQKDLQRQIILSVQQIRSHESTLLQIADLLIGAVCYRSRNLNCIPSANKGKVELVKLIEAKTGYKINKSTFLGETKFNLFRWQAAELSE